MSNGRYDLAILGGGGAAFAAAAKANELGAKAVLINKGLPLGGTCVNVGCVPSKFLLELGFDRWRMLHPRFDALSRTEPAFDFGAAIREKEDIVLASRRLKYKDVLTSYKHVELIEERARLDGPGRIRADNRLIEARCILIATGSSNKPLPIAGLETIPAEDILDNVKAFQLAELPESLIVIGGGPTGLEVAQMFAHFGAKVTILEAADRLFSIAEPEISALIEDALRDENIAVHTGARTKSARKEGDELVLSVGLDGAEREFRSQKLLIAAGVRGNTKDLNLSSIALKADKNGFIEVDEFMRTRAAGLYAAGDVAGPPWLETLAAREGAIAVENALEGKRLSINYDAVPAAVFTEPQIALVGLSEKQSIERFGRCECRVVELKFVTKAAITNQTRGVAKMVIHPETRALLGFQVASPHAAELIHEAALAIQHGLKVDDLVNLVHVFPTYAEVVKITAQAFKRDVRHMSCCVE